VDQNRRIVYRGLSMVVGWPEKIIEAQEIPSLTVQGKSILRVPYGDEQSDWGAARMPCGDCNVRKGEFHVPSCDVEECPACHGQLITCDCEFDEAATTGWLFP
jgi:hypothetical protein